MALEDGIVLAQVNAQTKLDEIVQARKLPASLPLSILAPLPKPSPPTPVSSSGTQGRIAGVKGQYVSNEVAGRERLNRQRGAVYL